MLKILIFSGILIIVALITNAIIHKRPKKKTLILCGAIMAFIALSICAAIILFANLNKRYDGENVMYPTTETVTDSFVIDSSEIVNNAITKK